MDLIAGYESGSDDEQKQSEAQASVKKDFEDLSSHPSADSSSSLSPSQPESTQRSKRLRNDEPKNRKDEGLVKSDALESRPSHEIVKKKPPPLPSSFLNLLPPADEKASKKPHSAIPTSSSVSQSSVQRVRNVPHVEGNWATYVYVPVSVTDALGDQIHESLEYMKTFVDSPHIELVDESKFHVSLTRTLYLRDFHINLFAQMVEETAKRHKCFTVALKHCEFYANDERNCVFLGVGLDTVTPAFKLLHALIKDLDAVMAEFRGAAFYDDPRPHVTCACVAIPDATAVAGLSASESATAFVEKLLSLPELPRKNLSSPKSFIEVRTIECKIGNKVFSFPLKSK